VPDEPIDRDEVRRRGLQQMLDRIRALKRAPLPVRVQPRPLKVVPPGAECPQEKERT
jgi:hypothetical protein